MDTTTLEVKVAPAIKDLGIDGNDGAKRRARVINKRIRTCAIKSKRAAVIARRTVSVKGGRRLFVSGVKPVIYGAEATGMPPTTVARLRTVAATATGMATSGSCTTTVISTELGEANDPAIHRGENKLKPGSTYTNR